MSHDKPIDGHDTDAKLSLQHRQQLSALLDGDLAPDQARFLLRRLDHDEALAGRWQRWHLIGDVLRGQPVVALPGGADGFASRVAASIARERAPATGRRWHWRHGLGVAAAASMAAVALFVARPLSVDSELPGVVAAPDASPSARVADTRPAPAEPVREVSVPQFAAATPADPPATSALEASAPARPASTAPEPAPSVVALAVESPGPGPEADSVTALASGAAPVLAGTGTPERPFASLAEPEARPWPRAVLPDLADAPGGRFTVGFGDTVEAPSFYPFEPQLPERAIETESNR